MLLWSSLCVTGHVNVRKHIKILRKKRNESTQLLPCMAVSCHWLTQLPYPQSTFLSL